MPISTDPTVAQVNGSTNGVHHNDSSKYDYDSVNLREFPHETPASVANRTSTIEDKLEPIAVVGLALKFPQDATDPTSFWRMMMDKNSARSGIPPERFNIDAFHSAEGNKNGMVSPSECTDVISITHETCFIDECRRGSLYLRGSCKLRCTILFLDTFRGGVHGPFATMASGGHIPCFGEW